MSFYLYQIGNGNDFGDEVNFFECESDFQNHINELIESGDNVYFRKLTDSLVEIISFMCNLNESDECINSNYEDLCCRFGADKIAMEFPNEHFDNNLIEKIKQNIKANYDDAMDSYSSQSSTHDGGIDWYSAGEEELKRMDKEDGGDWRIANDLG